MSLVIRLANITSPNDFVISYKSGATLGDITTGFTSYGTTYAGGTTEVIVSGISLNYETQYWFRLTDLVTNRHRAVNIYTHSYYYFFDCNFNGGSAIYTILPSVTPTITPSITPSITFTPTITPTLPPDCEFSGGNAGVFITPTPTVTPSITASVTLTPTPDASPSSTPTVTPTITESVTPTPTPDVTKTPTVTPSITITPTITPTYTPVNCDFNGGTAIYV